VGITWWTVARLVWLRERAATGLAASSLAREASRRYRRRVTAEAVRCAARRAGIPLLARGGRPAGSRRVVEPAEVPVSDAPLVPAKT